MYCRFINAQPSSAVTERARFAIVAIVVGLSVRSFSQGITNRMSAPGKAARMRAMNERRLFSKAVAPPVILWSFVPVRMIIVSSASSVNAAANAAASIESQLARLEPEAPNLWTRTPAPVARQLSPHNDTVPDTTSTLITLEAVYSSRWVNINKLQPATLYVERRPFPSVPVISNNTVSCTDKSKAAG
ncbi:Uncharacterised protein [Klebsiella pneumoniae]|uniref:Uncharacterized protein n=1 Tax=Klebsiella pneumoniae TaxID=573 RepID=A0A378FNQ3_KLEPN|nr:Uncharacterised protein [Klebsiella pneumoniae]